MLAGTAHANDFVALRSARADLEPLVTRLSSELASAGYDVHRQPFDPHASCVPRGTAWVSIALDLDRPDLALATICWSGVVVVTGGSLSDPARFAVTTAEALNGLRAEPLARIERPSAAPPAAARSPADIFPQRANSTRLALMQSLVIDPRGLPPLWGTALEGELPAGSRVSWLLAAFYPVSRAERSNSEVELNAGLAFVRFGLAIRQSFGDLGLSGSVAAGPALIWVHGDARPPRQSGRARTVSAIGSLGLECSYPANGLVFALATGRTTLLVPAARFVLPGDSWPTLGPLLFEAGIGIGMRI